MKSTLLISFVTFFLASCMQYNYYTISGKNIRKTETHQLISENDTLRVEYSFAERDGKVGLKIFNKTHELIEIDWKKSAVILGEKAISYYNPEAILAGRIENDTSASARGYRSNGNPVYLADIKASIAINEPSQFIFPRSYIFKASSPLPIAAQINGMDSLKTLRGEKVQIPSRGPVAVSYKRLQFQPEKSPLVFRSFLTFRTTESNSQKEFVQEHIFFISEMWQSASGAGDLPKQITERPDILSLYP